MLNFDLNNVNKIFHNFFNIRRRKGGNIKYIKGFLGYNQLSDNFGNLPVPMTNEEHLLTVFLVGKLDFFDFEL